MGGGGSSHVAARVAGPDCEGPPRSSAPPCSPAPPAHGAPQPTLQHGRGRVEVEGHGLHQVVVGAQALQLVPHQHRLAGARVPHQHHRPRLRHEQVHEVADADGFRGVHQRGLRGAEGGWGVTLGGPGESPAPPPHSRAHPNRAAPPFSSGPLQLSRSGGGCTFGPRRGSSPLLGGWLPAVGRRGPAQRRGPCPSKAGTSWCQGPGSSRRWSPARGT